MVGPAEGLRRARRVGVAKQLIAIRLSPRLLCTFRRMAAKQGKPYQTLIHEFLEKTPRGLPRGILVPARNDV